VAQQSQTVRSATSRLLEACPGAIRLYDVNLRDGGWDAPLVNNLLEGATIIKFNEVEAAYSPRHLDCTWRITQNSCARWRA